MKSMSLILTAFFRAIKDALHLDRLHTQASKLLKPEKIELEDGTRLVVYRVEPNA